MSTREEQLDEMANYVAVAIEPSIKTALRMATRCCPNCEHFNGSGKELCRLNGKHPPATIIAFGCELFKDNDIPF